MEPQRTSTHTHVERERKVGSGLAFIVGGLVVAVAVIAYYLFGVVAEDGDAGTNTSVEATTEAPAPVAPAGSGAAIGAAPAGGDARTGTAPAPAQQN